MVQAKRNFGLIWKIYLCCGIQSRGWHQEVAACLLCAYLCLLRAWSCFKAAKIRLLRRGASTFGLPAGISFDPWNLLVCLWGFGAVHKGRVMPSRLVKARGQIPGDVQSPAL